MKCSKDVVRRGWCMHTVRISALFVVIAALAACGGQPTPPAQQAPPPTTAPPPSAPLMQPAPEPAPTDDGAVVDAEGDIDADALIGGTEPSSFGEVIGYEDGVVSVQTPNGIRYIVEDPTPGILEQLERDSVAFQAGDGDISLPDDFPADIPLPEGVTLLAAHGDVDGDFLLQASTGQSLGELSTHFLQSMYAQDWKIARQSQDGGSYEQIHTIVFEKEGRLATVVLIATNRLPYQQVTVTLSRE